MSIIGPLVLLRRCFWAKNAGLVFLISGETFISPYNKIEKGRTFGLKSRGKMTNLCRGKWVFVNHPGQQKGRVGGSGDFS